MNFLCFTPKWCRWNPESPRPLTLWLNILYAVAGGFTSANMYYSHPILNVMAVDFHTTQGGVSSIPTLALAGEVFALLLILPLGDFFPRRKFTLTLLCLSMAFWVGLCVTNNLSVFMALTFLSAMFTGVTQILLPLVAELSTEQNRAFNISIVAMGPTMGILLARILSGIVANYTPWRNVYWMALGLQSGVLILLWTFMPDYPATNQISVKKLVREYPRILWSIVTLFVRHPVLVQASFLSLSTFFAVSSYWTTLTFLLSESPYHYSTLAIGLFGLIAAATLVLGPMYGKYIVQPIGSWVFSAMIGKTVSIVGVVIGTAVGKYNVAGPVIQALLLDAGLMILQISSRVAIHNVDSKAGNRVNTAFVGMLYVGMLSGTKAGNEVYERYGGWVSSGCLSIGMLVFGFIVILLRGPHEKRWIGWSGGWGRHHQETTKPDEEAAKSGKNGHSDQPELEKVNEPAVLESSRSESYVEKS